MGKFHFYTDIDLLNAQNTGDEYGVISSSVGFDKYRITDIHSSTGTPRIYAPTSGVICAQEDNANSSLVHLILKPTEVPPFNFYPIKYFIIKGVLKSSLVSGGSIIVDPDNEMLTTMKEAQDKINASIDEAAGNPPGTTTDSVSEAAFGLNVNSTTPGFADTDPIDNLFYQGDTDYQFPNVNAGWNIGKFDPAAFGMEIVLESITYEAPLKLCRNLSNEISVSSLGGGETQSQIFKHWHDKGVILNFVDPSAFYGSFYNYDIGTTDSLGTISFKEKNEIFDDILLGTSGNNFLNRSKVYLDLRNEHNDSLNYYGNYGNDFYFSYDDGTSVAPEDYYLSGWPLFVLDNSQLPGTISNEKIPVKVAFPEGDNNDPLVFFTVGYRNTNNPFKRIQGKKRFQRLSINTGVTEEFGLIVPNNDGATNTTPISTIFSLKLFRRRFRNTTVLTSGGTKIEGNKAEDNLFLPAHMKIPFPNTSGIRVKTFHENVYIDHFEERDEFVADISIAADDYGFTFLAYATDRRKRGLGIRKYFSFSSETNDSDIHFLDYITRNYPTIEYDSGLLQITGTDYQLLKTDHSSDNFLKVFNAPKVDELVVFYFSPADILQIESTITANNLLTEYKIFLGIANPTFGIDDNEVGYTTYDIILRGFIENSGVIEATEVTTNLKTFEV